MIIRYLDPWRRAVGTRIVFVLGYSSGNLRFRV